MHTKPVGARCRQLTKGEDTAHEMLSKFVTPGFGPLAR